MSGSLPQTPGPSLSHALSWPRTENTKGWDTGDRLETLDPRLGGGNPLFVGGRGSNRCLRPAFDPGSRVAEQGHRMVEAFARVDCLVLGLVQVNERKSLRLWTGSTNAIVDSRITVVRLFALPAADE